MSNKPYWVLIWLFILLLPACSAQPGTSLPPETPQEDVAQPAGSAATIFPNDPPATCPITGPLDVPFVPPSAYPATPPERYGRQFWFGTPGLWTMLEANGTWNKLPQDGNGYSQKIFWWRQGYNASAEPTPKLTVTGNRLDAQAPPLIASSATNAITDLGDAMLVGVDFPTLGCWEITGQYNDQELSFVVWVAP